MYHAAHRRLSWGLGVVALAGCLAFTPRLSLAQGAVPPHLPWAEDLVATIAPANNVYGSPALVQWKGSDGPVSTNKSVCATFVTALLKKSYGLSSTDIKNWCGSTSPNAERYHHTVVALNGFQRIHQVSAIQPGDIVAMDYRDGSDGSGHVAVASSTPMDKGLVTVGGVQHRLYEVAVIDSSASYHGKTDTRYVRKDGNTPDNGVGEGIMRIYARPADGKISGYSWSNVSASVFYPQPAQDLEGPGRHLVLGRLDYSW